MGFGKHPIGGEVEEVDEEVDEDSTPPRFVTYPSPHTQKNPSASPSASPGYRISSQLLKKGTPGTPGTSGKSRVSRAMKTPVQPSPVSRAREQYSYEALASHITPQP